MRPTTLDRAGLAALCIGLVLFKAWLVRAAGFDLHYDEAQYWEWSQHLDWSYYSKGPLVAWLIALSEFLFGHGDWQIRLPAWIAHAAQLVLVFHFALDVWHERAAAWWAVVIMLMTPLYFTLGLVMTTDVWLFLFWTWGLWACYRALCLDRPNAWIEAGIATGLGTLTKLSIGLLPAFVAVAVLLRSQWRRQLASPRLWLGVCLMLVLMSPVVIWNGNHEWVMLRHEQGHLQHTAWSLVSAAEFTAGQLFALSPLVVLLMVMELRRPPRDSGQHLLWLLTLAWFGFFLLKSLGAKVQLNWAAPSYIGMLILLAGHVPGMSPGRRRLLYAGIMTSMLMMAVAYFPFQFGLTGKRIPFREARGWAAPVQALAAQAGPVDFIMTGTYSLAAELASYWPRRIPVYIYGDERRFNQHDLWPGPEREQGRNGLWVGATPDMPARLEDAFAGCRDRPAVTARAQDGSLLRTLYSRQCADYRAIDWPRPSHY